ncbi:glycosyltransferase family 2 protein [Marinobacter sp. LV10R510-11A]|uniref:glycosyltransferase family 2 protein n=1 Tax=Marinobacter sp. LV10R510-11A TaxID=1415568 RepID=UPI0012FE71E3|nr:glycosyltransferase family 2 protein [Marinobacter sp. LV10R510-11A]
MSVIVPVFNGGDGLEFSLRSLLKQTLKKLEIIVVNDASTDNSEAVINHLASENGNIVAIHLPENQGVHEARLAGIKKAAAPWIGFSRRFCPPKHV